MLPSTLTRKIQQTPHRVQQARVLTRDTQTNTQARQSQSGDDQRSQVGGVALLYPQLADSDARGGPNQGCCSPRRLDQLQIEVSHPKSQKLKASPANPPPQQPSNKTSDLSDATLNPQPQLDSPSCGRPRPTRYPILRSALFFTHTLCLPWPHPFDLFPAANSTGLSPAPSFRSSSKSSPCASRPSTLSSRFLKSQTLNSKP